MAEKRAQIDPQLAVDIIQKWKRDPAVRSEFRSFAAYAAWREADAAGRIKIHGGRVKRLKPARGGEGA